MKSILSIAVTAAGAAAIALFATPANAAPAPAGLASAPAVASASPDGHKHAPVFVQTDDPAGNAVVAYQSNNDGSLIRAWTYPTGGLGGVLTGSVVDHLASQGSLAYDDGLLIAVNAGSNTITTFTVQGDRLARQQILGSAGDFPVSIAMHGHLVYVLNARGGGSVQGFVRVDNFLIPIPAWHRSLGLDPTLTPEFTHTPGEILFSPNGSQLLITTKAASNSVDVFSVGLGGLSATPTVTSLGATVPFAASFDRHGVLAVTEAGPSVVATFRVADSGALNPLHQAATGQKATCWIVQTDDRLYASNTGSASLTGYRTNKWGDLTTLGNTATGAGTEDAAVSSDGKFLYVQSGGVGGVDAFRFQPNGSLTRVGSIVVPGAIGGEGIVAL